MVVKRTRRARGAVRAVTNTSVTLQEGQGGPGLTSAGWADNVSWNGGARGRMAHQRRRLCIAAWKGGGGAACPSPQPCRSNRFAAIAANVSRSKIKVASYTFRRGMITSHF